MKKILLISILSFLCINYFSAQTTLQGMKYQAIARDISGIEISNEPISLKMTLHSKDANTKMYYSEIHNITTNEFGLFSLSIGEGNVVYGKFDEIPWAEENIWIEIALKEQGDDNYTTISNSKLLAVPYAYHANTASTLSTNSNISNDNNNAPKDGVPSQNWSLFGNSKSNPEKDKLGTTDIADLIIVTNNTERIRVLSSGETEVRENAQFDKNINVDGITKTDYLVVADEANDTIPDPYPRFGSIADIRGLLVADSIAIRGGLDIGGNLKVHGDSVIVDHHLLVGERTFLKGQVSINTLAPLTGADNDINAYPLKVEGSNQGIAVKVNGERKASKNFISFWDDNGMQGRIEGQTKSELIGSFEYIWYNSMEAIDLALGSAATIADLTGLDDFDMAVIDGIELIAGAAKWAEWNATTLANIGISYESGAGDYAEWLEKINLNETFSYGDIVGVNGGKISKQMTNASNFMVVSKNPIVLGNMPPINQESNFEKIAFMGQVPVKVRGKVAVGDYIIASNLNDGFGIAVSSKDITLNQFERIVGVAWSESANEFGFSMINVAVGINANDVVIKLKQQNQELNVIKSELNNIISYLKSKDKSIDFKQFEIQNKTVNVNEDNYSNAFKVTQNNIEENPEFIKQILIDAKKILDKKGVNYNQYEQTKRLLNDESYLLKILTEK